MILVFLLTLYYNNKERKKGKLSFFFITSRTARRARPEAVREVIRKILFFPFLIIYLYAVGVQARGPEGLQPSRAWTITYSIKVKL